MITFSPCISSHKKVDCLSTTFLIDIDHNGQPTYKAKDGLNAKFGVRFWPEVLPSLGIDHASLTFVCNTGAGKRPDPKPVNLHMLTLMGEKGPCKVIGLAK